ncbi:MAG: biotin--[acetyl-CoA-carboxylase] ligase [Oscillospiraceae bacterium]|nr:biotin--[acetyl-CoA-carboxylase] ligase [Oscillospiraceae bacterium]
MTENEVLKYLNLKNISLNVFGSVDSTNNVLRKMADEGAGEGTCVLANQQTAGRGRKGRSFYSPSGSGLYLSVLLRPQMQPEDSLLITTACAVAVSRAIENICKVKTYIKWVNDIYIDDRKVCGILTEAATNSKTEKLKYVILGIGINLYQPECGFPSDICSVASSVMKDKRRDTEDLRGELAAEILNQFFSIYPDLSDNKIFTEYKSKLFLMGKRVRVFSTMDEYDAQVFDIDKEYRLCVKKENGEIVKLDSGEVSTKMS